MSQKHVNRENEINDFATDYEIPSQVESSFEPTMGATSSDAKPARARKIQSRWERGSLRRAFQQRGVQLRGLLLVGFQPGPRSALAVSKARG